MTRAAIAIAALTACTTQPRVHLEIRPEPTQSVGVGLTQTYALKLAGCDGCVPYSPDLTELSVVVAAGTAAKVSPIARIDNLSVSFDITGLGPGSVELAINSDHFVTALSRDPEIEVAQVGSTSLFALQPTEDNAVPLGNVPGPVQLLAGSRTVIAQTHFGLDQRELAGVAPLVLDGAPPGVAIDPSCACVVSGNTLGRATVHALAGSLAVDVVDPSAIAAFTIDGSDWTAAPYGGVADVGYLLPRDAAGRTVVGRGPEPILTLADPTVAQQAPERVARHYVRALTLEGHAIGTTKLDITWGGAHETFTVKVMKQ